VAIPNNVIDNSKLGEGEFFKKKMRYKSNIKLDHAQRITKHIIQAHRIDYSQMDQ